MTDIDKLWNGYQKFYQKYFVENTQTYQDFVLNGQSPKTLVIACSDSRVDPHLILGTKPGEIFVIRNVANIVPPFEKNPKEGYHGTSAAIEYAVKYLKVTDIIVIGHSCCGGVKRLITGEIKQDLFIDSWVSLLDEIKQNTEHLDGDKRVETCEKEVIKMSVMNLEGFPFVKENLQNKTLSLHGWYFDLCSGKIEKIVEISE